MFQQRCSLLFPIDVEAVQIECFRWPEIIQLLHDNHIAVGKPPDCSTEITQPCDIGDCFRASKRCLRSIRNDDVADNEIMLQ